MNNLSNEVVTTDHLKFKTIKRRILEGYDAREGHVVSVGSDLYRGFGKTKFINELSLVAMSEGKTVLTIGNKFCEYWCDKFLCGSRDLELQLRGRRYDVILLDELDYREWEKIKTYLQTENVYGFVFRPSVVLDEIGEN